MRKPDFCICENKDADQLRGYREADQRLCFRYTDSIIPLLLKSEISSLQTSSVVVQPSLCLIRSETPKTGFLTTRLNNSKCNNWQLKNEELLEKTKNLGFESTKDSDQTGHFPSVISLSPFPWRKLRSLATY